MDRKTLLGLAAVLVLAAACSEDPATPAEDGLTQLATVIPAGGSTGVDPNAPIVIEFTHAMQHGSEMYVALHEGGVTGPVVAGTWTWSTDGTRLTFTPASPLKPRTTYTIHIGGRMRDADGHPVGFTEHGQHMGGQWATSQMMMTHGGMMQGWSGHMGSGWQHANGTYGMVFPFTTA